MNWTVALKIKFITFAYGVEKYLIYCMLAIPIDLVSLNECHLWPTMNYDYNSKLYFYNKMARNLDYS